MMFKKIDSDDEPNGKLTAHSRSFISSSSFKFLSLYNRIARIIPFKNISPRDSGRISWTDNGRLKTLNLLFHPRVTFDVVEAGRFLPLTVFPLVSLVCTLFCTLQ